MKSEFNPKSFEKKWYKYWTEKKIFQSEPNSKKPYTILIPPPNVTGILHMGHMLNNTIQDILVRRAKLLGFNTCWVPGTDHASIATEAKVINHLETRGISKSSLSRDEFLKYAWEWKDKHGSIILDQLKRLGVSCDWRRLKFTMDDDMSQSVIQTFVKLYNKGLIYKGERMINWDPKAKTAISDEEVIYKEQKSKLYYVNYKLLDSHEFLTVATTRPETILGDTALCVNPNDQRYKKLIGKKVLVPIINRKIPIVSDNYIDPEFGTGVLKVTPAHDINDFNIGKKNNLEIINVIDDSGLMNSNATSFTGMDRFFARKKIIEDIDSIGQLSKVEDILNKVGYSERTNVVIEPKLSSQWFLKMDNISKKALESVVDGEINFYPSKMVGTYKHWLENIKDWCLSRQLWWGHQIPVFYFNDNEYVVAENKTSALKLAKLKSKNNKLKLSDLKQDEDVLDTWFSSWIWPMSVFDGVRNPKNKDFNYYYPTSDLVTGPDILFFWVARMIISGYEFTGKFPFKNVYFTGIVRDNKRRKMSKSLGNSPDPIKLIDEYGADGVRTAMLFASPAGNDLLFDVSLCQQGRNFSNKIWNAFRLIHSWNPIQSEQSQSEKVAIEWFKIKINIKLSRLEKLFTEFRISDCLILIYKLIWDDFCSTYLELVKTSNKNISSDTLDKTKDFFNDLLVILHPFMPFITEEIWQSLNDPKNNNSIIESKWPSVNEEIDKVSLLKFEKVFSLVAEIRKIRLEKNIPFKKSIKLLYEDTDEFIFSDVLLKMCNVYEIEKVSKDKKNLFPFMVNANKYYIPLLFKIDKKIEIEKIKDKIVYLKSFLKSVEKKLSNTSFVKNAPEHVIEIEKKKKRDTINKLNSLNEQIKNF